MLLLPRLLAAFLAAAALVTAATVAEAPLAALSKFFILMYFDGLIFEIDMDAFP